MTLEGDQVWMPTPAEAIEVLNAHIRADALNSEQWEVIRKWAAGRQDENKETAYSYKLTPTSKVTMPLPLPMLSAVGRKGAILSVGEVMILAADGSTGKSSWVAGLALEIAAVPSGEYMTLPSGFLQARGGRVMIMSYEDWPSINKKKVESLAALRASQSHKWRHLGYLPFEDAVDRVLIVEEAELDDIYGQNPEQHIDTRPIPLEGWYRFWATVPEDLLLVIIDPAMDAYTGNGNGVSHVRSFIKAVRSECLKRQIAVIVLHHSTKEVRRGKSVSLEEYDEFDLFSEGLVMGSTGWTDGTRSVMTMTGRNFGDLRKVGIFKASWGERWLVHDLKAIRLDEPDNPLWDRMIIGFDGQGTWHSPMKPQDTGNGRNRQSHEGPAGIIDTSA